MNYLIIGNLCSGKTSLANALCKHVKGPYVALDDMRRMYGNGRFSGEFRAWSEFLFRLEAARDNHIFEFSGTGRNKWFVSKIIRDKIADGKKWEIIECWVPDTEICDERANAKSFDDIPLPYTFNEGHWGTICFMRDELRTMDDDYFGKKHISIALNRENDYKQIAKKLIKKGR